MITRFAPSPTGPLHLGHAYAALVAERLAAGHGGRFLVRIDDLDQSRSRPAWEAQIFDDLHWLGLDWPVPVRRQSDHPAEYASALGHLTEMGLTYPCRCTRRDIDAAASAPQEGAPEFGPDGRIYPGTCRARPMAERGPTDAIRLDMARAAARLTGDPGFDEIGPGFAGRHRLSAEDLITSIGDIVLARRDMGASYHLGVVVDDAAQGVSHVTRGEDLFEATRIHVLLQHLLGLPTPVYHHHALIRDETGKRLAKRDDARAIATYRAEGLGPADLRAMLPEISSSAP
ncbi:tRNA glutamyl-Q(34) synthetase GluQRS [Poseidonocella sedimentorum]|uniref:tRNA glutamyl-Q(34) synthetase GluQRS n=1 Tax=Poseidonocella sedimentorum TaxID=871652 RepID=UPI000AF144D6|nr:tRNA glutamyl-Q(34) synthetase GluQRS [Poseidonocella sedimentorum]